MMGLRLELRRTTIYVDLKNVPDPVYLGITAQCFNQTAGNLALYLNGEGSGWTFTQKGVGTVQGGRSHRYSANEFGFRSKPSSETTETITVILTGGSYEHRQYVTIHFIDSEDGSWTEDEEDNFDDGMFQGWTHVAGAGKNSFIVGEYKMSAPYSLRGSTFQSGWGFGYHSITLRKNFTTPNRNQVYAICYIRARRQGPYSDGFFNAAKLDCAPYSVLLGWQTGAYPYAEMVKTGYPPSDQWLKLMCPMPPNTNLDVDVEGEFYHDNFYGCWGFLYLDDFRIISKD